MDTCVRTYTPTGEGKEYRDKQRSFRRNVGCRTRHRLDVLVVFGVSLAQE